MPQINYALLTVSLAASLIISAIMTKAALKVRVITRDAAIPAFMVGFMTLMGGLATTIPFIAFLGTSSAVTRLGSTKKEEIGVAMDMKGRNWRQVMAVGLLPSSLALTAGLAYLMSNYYLFTILSTAAVGGIAYSNADTWASEIGVLSRSKPRLLIKPWKTVDPGVSGGVTWLGELSSMGGSAFTALTFLGSLYMLRQLNAPVTPSLTLAMVVFIMGYLGEVLDSLLGGLLQPKYYCPRCGVMTDHSVHQCGQLTIRVFGNYEIGNEDVNLIVSLIVTILSIAITALLLNKFTPPVPAH
ncbi:DUF92 domain-containing protein [Vulcanisaeta thermophila]|uniref:DUF92 domain-containing protein n=1 Tax=Vulcanisaeta thermophila TaxID=867917 RepID=UPI000853015D|nr:DUF92 domain-containing protein [Vulcanisaeta thermophila]